MSWWKNAFELNDLNGLNNLNYLNNFWWQFLMTIFDDNLQIFGIFFQTIWKSCDLTLDTWDTDYIADNWEQQY